MQKFKSTKFNFSAKIYKFIKFNYEARKSKDLKIWCNLWTDFTLHTLALRWFKDYGGAVSGPTQMWPSPALAWAPSTQLLSQTKHGSVRAFFLPLTLYTLYRVSDTHMWSWSNNKCILQPPALVSVTIIRFHRFQTFPGLKKKTFNRLWPIKPTMMFNKNIEKFKYSAPKNKL